MPYANWYADQPHFPGCLFIVRWCTQKGLTCENCDRPARARRTGCRRGGCDRGAPAAAPRRDPVPLPGGRPVDAGPFRRRASPAPWWRAVCWSVLCVIAVCRARGPCGLAAPGTSKITGSEGWDHSQERWRLIDAQLDAVWQNRLQLDDGVLDIGRHRFLVVAMHGHTVVPVKSTRNYSASRSPSTTL